jgi:hypothetical protein
MQALASCPAEDLDKQGPGCREGAEQLKLPWHEYRTVASHKPIVSVVMVANSVRSPRPRSILRMHHNKLVQGTVMLNRSSNLL